MFIRSTVIVLIIGKKGGDNNLCLNSNLSVAVDDKAWVYCAGMVDATEEQWDLAWQRLQE